MSQTVYKLGQGTRQKREDTGKRGLNEENKQTGQDEGNKEIEVKVREKVTEKSRYEGK